MSKDLARKLMEGDRRSLARAITIVENQDPQASEIIAEVYPKTGNAKIVGITGLPGVGKSTLIDKIAGELANESLKVGIIAIDPSSPFTGGAILGDRIRIRQNEEEIFFRSIGTHGKVGGLSEGTHDIVKLMDAHGMDFILIETVGAGHSDVKIERVVDTCIVVLMPEAGDEIQTMKAGLMEIGDIFVVNKADIDGSEKMLRHIKRTTEMKSKKTVKTPKKRSDYASFEGINQKGKQEWKPPVLKTIAERSEGIDKLLGSINKHQKYLEKSGALKKKREERRRGEMIKILRDRITAKLVNQAESNERFENLVKKVAIEKKVDPKTAAEKLISELDL